MASSSAPGRGSMVTMGIRIWEVVIGTAEDSTAIPETGIAVTDSTAETASMAAMRSAVVADSMEAAVDSMEVMRSAVVAGSMQAEADSMEAVVLMEEAGGR